MYNFKENESLYATIVDTVTPTTSTEGVVGQFYIDQSTDPASLYLCTKVETVDSTTTYTWTKQGGKQLYQHNVVMTWSGLRVITFTLTTLDNTPITTGTMVQTLLYNNGFTGFDKLLPCNTVALLTTQQENFDGLYCPSLADPFIYYRNKRQESYKTIKIDETDTIVMESSKVVTNDSFGTSSMSSIRDTVVAL